MTVLGQATPLRSVTPPPSPATSLTALVLQVSDGSSLSGLQVVVNAGVSGHQQLVEGRINTGAAVSARGTLVQSPGGKQSVSTLILLSNMPVSQSREIAWVCFQAEAAEIGPPLAPTVARDFSGVVCLASVLHGVPPVKNDESLANDAFSTDSTGDSLVRYTASDEIVCIEVTGARQS